MICSPLTQLRASLAAHLPFGVPEAGGCGSCQRPCVRNLLLAGWDFNSSVHMATFVLYFSAARAPCIAAAPAQYSRAAQHTCHTGIYTRTSGALLHPRGKSPVHCAARTCPPAPSSGSAAHPGHPSASSCPAAVCGSSAPGWPAGGKEAHKLSVEPIILRQRRIGCQRQHAPHRESRKLP